MGGNGGAGRSARAEAGGLGPARLFLLKSSPEGSRGGEERREGGGAKKGGGGLDLGGGGGARKGMPVEPREKLVRGFYPLVVGGFRMGQTQPGGHSPSKELQSQKKIHV